MRNNVACGAARCLPNTQLHEFARSKLQTVVMLILMVALWSSCLALFEREVADTESTLSNSKELKSL
jgi:hypothetical protein